MESSYRLVGNIPPTMFLDTSRQVCMKTTWAADVAGNIQLLKIGRFDVETLHQKDLGHNATEPKFG